MTSWHRSTDTKNKSDVPVAKSYHVDDGGGDGGEVGEERRPHGDGEIPEGRENADSHPLESA